MGPMSGSVDTRARSREHESQGLIQALSVSARNDPGRAYRWVLKGSKGLKGCYHERLGASASRLITRRQGRADRTLKSPYAVRGGSSQEAKWPLATLGMSGQNANTRANFVSVGTRSLGLFRLKWLKPAVSSIQRTGARLVGYAEDNMIGSACRSHDTPNPGCSGK
jgi:hypothetical protein